MKTKIRVLKFNLFKTKITFRKKTTSKKKQRMGRISALDEENDMGSFLFRGHSKRAWFKEF